MFVRSSCMNHKRLLGEIRGIVLRNLCNYDLGIGLRVANQRELTSHHDAKLIQSLKLKMKRIFYERIKKLGVGGWC